MLAQLRSGELTVELFAIILGEVWGLPVKVIASFSAVCLDLPSSHLIVRHNLVLSVMWSMLSTNSLHCLWRSHHSLSTAGARRDPVCIGRLAPPAWLRSPLGLVACKAYVFQWGYDGKQPSIVSFGTTSRLSGNQLEDYGSSVCVLSLARIGSSLPS